MANDEERAGLRGHIAALETRVQALPADKQPARNYVIKTQVFDECIGLPPPDGPEEPPTAPAGGESVHTRLDRIEAQLQRVIEILEGKRDAPRSTDPRST